MENFLGLTVEEFSQQCERVSELMAECITTCNKEKIDVRLMEMIMADCLTVVILRLSGQSSLEVIIKGMKERAKKFEQEGE